MAVVCVMMEYQIELIVIYLLRNTKTSYLSVQPVILTHNLSIFGQLYF